MHGIVSVIIPVYNVEKYLHSCVSSICSQSYSCLEILLIDDGSTDSSGRICDDLASQDERIRVFHRQNEGVASARNFGLNVARGDWILLVDADDFVCLDLIESCLEALSRTGAELAVFQYQSVDADGNNHEYDGPLNQFDKEMTLSSVDALYRVINGPFEHYPWCCLSTRALYEEPMQVRYPENRDMEDEATEYKLHAAAASVVYIPKRLYNYRQHESSRMNCSKEISLASARATNAWEMYVFLDRYDLPTHLYQSLVRRTVEKEIGAYYGALRSGAGSLDTAYGYLRQIIRDHAIKPSDLSLGLGIRMLAMKCHCASALVALERFLGKRVKRREEYRRC